MDNKKNNTGYHIPMIDLGENEKVTAVFFKFFLNACSSGVIIFRNNFIFLQSLLNRTQEKLVSKCDFDFHFPPY